MQGLESSSTRSALGGWLLGGAGASAVALGAFGAHALRDTLNAQSIELWHTAVQYHFYHALALGLAVLLGGSARRAMLAFAIGIVLFSGSLYVLALGAPRLVGVITPLGGVSFIVGWILLGVSILKRR